MAALDFDTAFTALTGNQPFPWQRALYKRFVSDRDDNIPVACNLPTGLGKTSVIAVWLIALVNCRDRIPRRLVYVVNRRTVVDQTTDEVEKYRRNLQAVPDVNKALWELCALRPRLSRNTGEGGPGLPRRHPGDGRGAVDSLGAILPDY